MIKTFLTGISLAFRSAASQRRPLLPPIRHASSPLYAFCSSKDITAAILTPPPGDIKVSCEAVGDEEVEVVKTTGAVSIMDRVPGVKADNGEMYVLSFTCTKCETKSIRSFTKHAYHKGVVLVRCGGC
jgi:hypothetical protein